jgi:sulfide:quinone oxidoreductase
VDVVIVGGGVAGLEALPGLRAMAGDRVRLTLAAPEPDFSYRPLAVAEPFALGHAYRVPLSRFAEDTGAELVLDATVGVDDAAGRVRLRTGLRRPARRPRRRCREGRRGRHDLVARRRPGAYGGLLRDLDEGYAQRIAIVVPPGAVWPLPAYELALVTAGQAIDMATATSGSPS